ncbi:MAG: hypothetical protein ACK2UP_17185 [Candidatus Promineifilaceae bacterium]|jgi:hypothetical protein
MGYVDEDLYLFVPPQAVAHSAGTWTLAVASNVWSTNRTAADAAWVTYVPVPVPAKAKDVGAKLLDITVMFSVATGALDSLAAAIYKDTLAADGTLNTAASVTTTYDTGHDSAAERIDIDEHRMTLTLSTPVFIDGDGETYHLEISGDAAANSVFKFFGALVHYRLRA